MTGKVLLQGLEEAVSREHQPRECQSGGKVERQIWGVWERAGSSGREGLSHLLQVTARSQTQDAEMPDLMGMRDAGTPHRTGEVLLQTEPLRQPNNPGS